MQCKSLVDQNKKYYLLHHRILKREDFWNSNLIFFLDFRFPIHGLNKTYICMFNNIFDIVSFMMRLILLSLEKNSAFFIFLRKSASSLPEFLF